MSERREARRRRVYMGGRIVHGRIHSDTDCLLRNLSSGGARVVVSAAIPLPNRFDIVIAFEGTTYPVEMIWRRDDEMGVRLMAKTPEQDHVVELADSIARNWAELTRLRAQISDLDLRTRVSERTLH